MTAGLGTVHVVGAGLAGLAAAVRLAAEGRGVRLTKPAVTPAGAAVLI